MAARHPFRRGDVVLRPFEFSNATGQKNRPGILLSTGTYHGDWDEILLVEVISRLPAVLRITDYELQNWAAAGLTRRS